LDEVEAQSSSQRAERISTAYPEVNLGTAPVSQLSSAIELTSDASVNALGTPWRSLLALLLALFAQSSLEPRPSREWVIGGALFLSASALVISAFWRSELVLAPLRLNNQSRDPMSFRVVSFFVAILLGMGAFAMFGGNQFTVWNLTLWVLSVAAFIHSLWLPKPQGTAASLKGLLRFFDKERPQKITLEMLLVAMGIILVVFFRVYRLDSTPPEMVSDHAEKLLDIWDVLAGQTSIFFPRNTGREALQMYLTAGIIELFNTGFSFMSLKIGAVFAGLLTLVYTYLLGKETGGKRVAFFALLFAGIAYWPNIISRVGLRFPLYPLFVAPVLYYLLRGLRERNRNDFILSGIFLGLGLHGYTPIRILPLVILVGFGLFLIHRQSKGARKDAPIWLAVLALVALFIFLPLLRFAVENPEMFAFRSFSRLGGIERELPGPVAQIFLSNLWRALTMFVWDDGQIWVTSVTNRPALDIVSGALFIIGVLLIFLRYIKELNWVDLFLLFSVPLLLLPSVLSLAFPAENPSLNRMAGAVVPVFLIVAMSFDALLGAVERCLGRPAGKWAAYGLALLLLLISSAQNFDLVFNQYQTVYAASAWNTSEMGAVIREFGASTGTPDTAWVVAFPHWVDTRLVGMNAGYPLKDYAIWIDRIEETFSDPRAKLFLVKPDDEEAIQTLIAIYPLGSLQLYSSQTTNHDFYMFVVPAVP
jgi:preprotein translocase subunit Sec61beta